MKTDYLFLSSLLENEDGMSFEEAEEIVEEFNRQFEDDPDFKEE